MKNYYFFIGTEAEFIKLLPVILEFEKNKILYKIIATGQNKIHKSNLFKYINKKSPDITVSDEPIKQTIVGLLFWFFKTFFSSFKVLRQEFKSLDKNKTFLIVHGDTVSTPMGAILGKIMGVKVAHVEAGLRSFNWFNPFPEEINRVISSHFADVFFCPNDWAVNNLKGIRGEKINTKQNTLYNSVRLAVSINKKIDIDIKEKYFIFVMHRQENIYNKDRVIFLLNQIANLSKKMKCIFVMHEPTRISLEKMGLLEDLKKNKNINIIARQPFFSFISLLKDSELIITDGGSNQEESYYLGKPCLILREHTERIEGLGENVVLSKNDTGIIKSFIKNYTNYKRNSLALSFSPSEIIANYFKKI